MAMEGSLRILTLNAHQGFGAQGRRNILLRIRDALRTTGADLVFLQEVGVAHGAEAPVEQYEVLADGIWKSHAYGRNAVKTSGHHGNAVLSRYPIVGWENVDVSVGGSERRGILHCTLNVPNVAGLLHAVCVHLALREKHRVWQVEWLLELITDRIPADAALVVAGDFNDWRLRAHRRLVREAGLVEVHAGRQGRPARTFPARYPVLRLDRIYVRNLQHAPLPVPHRPWSTLSDHKPLRAMLMT